MIRAKWSTPADLCINEGRKPFEPAARLSRSWRGFAAELVTIGGPGEYSFERESDAHYVALHDIVLDEGEVFVDDWGPDQQRDLRDTITFLPAGCAITGWSAPAPRSNKFTALYFEPLLLREEVASRYKDVALAPVLFSRDEKLRATMQKFQTVLSDKSLDSVYAESACLLASLEVLSIRQAEPAGQLSLRQTNAVMEYIRANLSQDISLSDLSNVAGLSRYHFGRAFKATIGVSPYAFILQSRVDAACDLMSTGNLSIEELARRCGFGTTANLRRKFLIAKGVTPTAYRRGLK